MGEVQYLSPGGHWNNSHFQKLAEDNQIDVNTAVQSMQEIWSSKY